VGIFKELREKKNWSKYQAAKELGLTYSEYERLEQGTTGERFIKYLLNMCKATNTPWSEVKKISKSQTLATPLKNK